MGYLVLFIEPAGVEGVVGLAFRGLNERLVGQVNAHPKS